MFSFLVVDGRKTADTVFVVLSFSFQIWEYSPTATISLGGWMTGAFT